mgnify:CR=1 FL=1
MSIFQVDQISSSFSAYSSSNSVSTIPISCIDPSGSFHMLKPGIPWSHFENAASMSIAVQKSSSFAIEADPADPSSVQFRIPSQSAGTNHDRVAFYISGSGEIGIGTKDPASSFDVRDIKQDVDPARANADKEVLLKLSRDAGGRDLKAETLRTARTIGGVSFNGSANINLPGVNAAGNQSTTGNAATATSASYASTGSVLSTARAIGGVDFDGSAAIIPKSHMGSITTINLTPGDFYANGTRAGKLLTPHAGGGQFLASAAGTYVANIHIPYGLTPTHCVIYGSDTRNTVLAWVNEFATNNTTALNNGRTFAVGTTTAILPSSWRGDRNYLTITVTTDGADSIYGGHVTVA